MRFLGLALFFAVSTTPLLGCSSGPPADSSSDDAVRSAARPDLAEIRAYWDAIEAVEPSDLTSWHAPVEVRAEPTFDEIRSLMKIGKASRLNATGHEAIAEFQRLRQPEMFAPIARFLESSAVEKVWLITFADEDDENWEQYWLMVFDDQNRLWGMSVGYSI